MLEYEFGEDEAVSGHIREIVGQGCDLKKAEIAIHCVVVVVDGDVADVVVDFVF